LAKVGGVKRFSFLASLLLAASVVLSPRAAGPDDEFIRAYIQITQADNLAKSAQNSSAAAKYQEALNTLKALKSGNPGWKTGVIDFRIDYVTKKLKALNVSNPDTPTTPKPAVFDAETARLRISDLTRRLESLENNLTLKDAQLKEALAAAAAREARLRADLEALREADSASPSPAKKRASKKPRVRATAKAVKKKARLTGASQKPKGTR